MFGCKIFRSWGDIIINIIIIWRNRCFFKDFRLQCNLGLHLDDRNPNFLHDTQGHGDTPNILNFTFIYNGLHGSKDNSYCQDKDSAEDLNPHCECDCDFDRRQQSKIVTTLWHMMMHHYTKSAGWQFSGSEDFFSFFKGENTQYISTPTPPTFVTATELVSYRGYIIINESWEENQSTGKIEVHQKWHDDFPVSVTSSLTFLEWNYPTVLKKIHLIIEFSNWDLHHDSNKCMHVVIF